MSKSTEAIRKARARPHSVVAICDAETDEILQYRIAAERDDGDLGTRIDEEKQYCKVVALAPTAAVAERVLKQLKEWSIKDVRKEAPKLPHFDESLPTEPRARAAAFQAMSQEAKEEVVQRTILRSGQKLTVIAKWFGISKTELLTAVDPVVLSSATAELHMRIGAAMMETLDSKNPSANTNKIFLCKTILGWKDDGSTANDDSDESQTGIEFNVSVIKAETE